MIRQRYWPCLLFASIFWSLAGCSRNDSAPPIGSPTSLQLIDLDGQAVDIWNQNTGRAAVFVFTRTDCPIANRYAPEIRRLYEKYHGQGVQLYLVYVDPREMPQAIRKHLRQFEFPCQAIRDPKHTFVALCGATVTPEAAVFDTNRVLTYLGRIDDRYIDLGKPRNEPTTHDLADAIESTIQGQPVSQPRAKAVGCLIADLKDSW